MTTRRDILTGLAALPITVATGGEVEAAPVSPMAHAEPSLPPFIHDIDRQIAREIDTMEQLLATMKDRLAVANNPHPMIRSGALLDLRCSFNAFRITAEFAREGIEVQRIHAEDAARAYKARPIT